MHIQALMYENSLNVKNFLSTAYLLLSDPAATITSIPLRTNPSATNIVLPFVGNFDTAGKTHSAIIPQPSCYHPDYQIFSGRQPQSLILT
jgi:hypothetical protein